MTDLHLDTHVLVWLYAGEHSRFPERLRERLAVDQLRFSPMARLELTYLHEIGRIGAPADRIIDELQRSIGLVEDRTAFDAVIRAAETQTWTRDPFDRIIAAQSLVAFASLATKDERVQQGLGQYAVWD
ncbi:MAG: PIN domain-containing protein [Propionibacteriales bacterium]|nr:PIN domain-containing protein [Propionibacteriales bacterium]